MGKWVGVVLVVDLGCGKVGGLVWLAMVERWEWGSGTGVDRWLVWSVVVGVGLVWLRSCCRRCCSSS